MPETGNIEEPQQGLQQDPLIEKLLPDLSEKQPGVGVLSGFLGKSSLQGHWRLYLTPALDVYLEIPEADIVHNQALASEGSILGGTVLWVKQDADIELHTRTNLRQNQAQLLSGQSQAKGQGMASEEATSLATFITSKGLDPGAIGCLIFSPFCTGSVPSPVRGHQPVPPTPPAPLPVE